MRLARIKSLSEHALGFDTETWLIGPDLPLPPIVCGSAAWLIPGPKIQSAIYDKQATLELFCQALEDPNAILVGANIGGFDLAVCAAEFERHGVDVMPWIFKMLEEERVFDILIAQSLDAIANGTLGKDPRTMGALKDPITKKPGRYSLSIVTDLVLGRTDAKSNDLWRLRYRELDGIPLDQWPQEAIDYPKDDAHNQCEVGLAQAGVLPQNSPRHNWASITNQDGSTTDRCADCGSTRMNVACQTRRMHRNLHDLSAQVATAFCLHLGASHGFQVDQAYVDIIERHAIKKRVAGIDPFIAAGILRADETEDRAVLKRMVALAYGAWEQCPHCAGTGKRPSPNAKPVRCPSCKGYCLVTAKDGPKCREWRAMAGPEGCLTCSNVGLVPNPNPNLITCGGTDDSGDAEKTCDGSGLKLSDDVPKSEKGGISYGRDCLSESGDETLMSYAAFLEDGKVLKDYVPWLREARITDPIDGTTRDVAMTLRPNVLLETGRVSYSGGYIQLMPRKPGYVDRATGEYIPSLRECFKARPGYVYSSEDYAAGELVTHSQSLLWLVGWSRLAEALNADLDPHRAFGMTLLGLNYEDYDKKIPMHAAARQIGKGWNFGKPGGASDPTVVIQQRVQGRDTPSPFGPSMVDDGQDKGILVPGYKGMRICILMGTAERCGITKTTVIKRKNWERKIAPTCCACIAAAEKLGQVYKRQWPETDLYFAWVKDMVENGMLITEEMLERWEHWREVFKAGERLAPGEAASHVSGRIRGGLEFTSGANSMFQTMLGDIAKSALRRISRECYDATYRVPQMLHATSKPTSYAGAQSPLYGSRVIGFFHDELFSEHAESVAHDAAMRVSEVMVDEMIFYCPDMAKAAKAEPALARRWYKSATAVKGEDGRLIPWEPS